MNTKAFLNVNEVAEYMGISVSKAYQIIQDLNAELKAKGYITIAGKISAAYFMEKIYGLGPVA